jgi:hypothetical protein
MKLTAVSSFVFIRVAVSKKTFNKQYRLFIQKQTFQIKRRPSRLSQTTTLKISVPDLVVGNASTVCHVAALRRVSQADTDLFLVKLSTRLSPSRWFSSSLHSFVAQALDPDIQSLNCNLNYLEGLLCIQHFLEAEYLYRLLDFCLGLRIRATMKDEIAGW